MIAVELVGNALCLDFANTVNRRPDPARDWLASPEELRTWMAAVGFPPVDGDPSPAHLEHLRTLREHVHDLFADVVDAVPIRPAALAAVLGAYAAVLARNPSARTEDRLTVTLDVRDPKDLPGPVAVSAVELLHSGTLSRLGRCPNCGWLFLDTSRNGRRRWCSMATCGSRDKSARYFERTRRGAHPKP